MFRAVTPARVLDTRVGNGAAARAVRPEGTVVLKVAGRGGVPASGVGAVALNVTVTQGSSTGYITAYPAGAARPTASVLKYVATARSRTWRSRRHRRGGQPSNGTGPGHIVADVQGYYLAGTATVAGAFAPLTPSRLLDTRTGNGAPQRPVAARGTLGLKVLGRGGVPASGVGTVTLNVTATGEARSGYVTAYPAGTSRPSSSNLNHVAHQSIPILVVVKVGSRGRRRSLQRLRGQRAVGRRRRGLYPFRTAAAQGAYVPLSPLRVMDTRTGVGEALAVQSRVLLRPESWLNRIPGGCVRGRCDGHGHG